MKKFWANSVLIVFFMLLSLSSYALTVTSLAQLSFGKIAANSGGSVILSPAGSRTRTGSVAILTSETGSAARFRLQGNAGLAYIVTLPLDNDVILTSGGNSMSLTDFTISPANPGNLDGAGEQIISLGATLNIGSLKPPGEYSGTISFTVDYQ